MKTSAEKSSHTSATVEHQTSSRPFFAKAGGGDFFAPVSYSASPSVQTKLTVNKPGDRFEQEADKMADKVMRMPAPAPPAKEEKIQRATLPEEKVQKKEEDKIQKATLPEEKVQKKEDEKIQKATPPEEKVQKKEDEKIQKATLPEEKVQKKEEEKLQRDGGNGSPAVAGDTQSSIKSKTSGGQPLSSEARSYMEPRFNADFSNVRIHSDPESAGLSNQLSARAFTYQNHVFFSRDQYQPGTSEGKQLLAHELTHTIQQGHAIQRSPQITTTVAPPPIQRLGIQDALDYFADKAYYIPGFRMLTILMGFNPINMRSTDRSAANILRALIELIPGGHFITQALDNHGVFTKAGAWVEQQIATLGDIGGDIVSGLRRFVDSLSWRDIFDLSGVWERAKRIFTNPIGRLVAFAGSVVSGLLKLVKNAILKPLAALAQGTRGYDLLKAVLGEDPITGEPVPRNAETLIGGFMKLIGQEEVWENIKKGNAIARAWAWFQGALGGLMGLVRAIPRRIIDTITSLTFMDIITVVGALGKIIGAFVNIATDFIRWGLDQVLIDAGSSSVLALEPPAGDEAWPLTISDPADSGTILARISAKQRALGASGIRKSDHIVNPLTRAPVRSRLAAWVSAPRVALAAISRRADVDASPTAVADALSTAFMISPVEEIAAYCEKHPGLEVWILERELTHFPAAAEPDNR